MARSGGLGTGRRRDGRWRQDSTTMATGDDDDGDGATGDEVFNERTNERTDKQKNERTNERMNERIYERTNEQSNK